MKNLKLNRIKNIPLVWLLVASIVFFLSTAVYAYSQSKETAQRQEPSQSGTQPAENSNHVDKTPAPTLTEAEEDENYEEPPAETPAAH